MSFKWSRLLMRMTLLSKHKRFSYTQLLIESPNSKRVMRRAAAAAFPRRDGVRATRILFVDFVDASNDVQRTMRFIVRRRSERDEKKNERQNRRRRRSRATTLHPCRFGHAWIMLLLLGCRVGVNAAPFRFNEFEIKRRQLRKHRNQW